MSRTQAGTLFRRTFKGWESAKWSGAFTVGGRRRVVTLYTDKQASRAALDRLIKDAEREREGLIDPALQHRNRPIAEAVAEYLASCQEEGQASRHVATKRCHLRRFVDLGRWQTLADLSVDSCERVLIQISRDGKSPRTINQHRATVIAFANYLYKRGRLARHDLDRLSSRDERLDRRRVRRALSDGEVRLLLKAAALRPLAELGRASVARESARCRGRSTWNKAPLSPSTLEAAAAKARTALQHKPDLIARLERLGRERVLIYRTLLLTGLRKSELASLRVAQIALHEEPPVVRLSPDQDKSRRGASLPLHPDLATELKSWLAERLDELREEAQRSEDAPPTVLPPTAKAFRMGDSFTQVMKRDLAAAGIDRIIDGCVVDVHSLRHTFATNLVRAGVHPRVAQAAMRHSRLELTMRTYTDPRMLDVAEAVSRLDPNQK